MIVNLKRCTDMCERGLFWVKRAEGLVCVEDWSKKLEFGSERFGVEVCCTGTRGGMISWE